MSIVKVVRDTEMERVAGCALVSGMSGLHKEDVRCVHSLLTVRFVHTWI